MPTKRLNATHIERQRPPVGKRNTIIWDAEVKGFGMRVNQGKKSWLIGTRLPDGRQIRHVFSNTSRIADIVEARDEARRLLRLAADGIDPKTEKADKLAAKKIKDEAEKAESQKQAYSFRVLAGEYLASPVSIKGRHRGRPLSASYRQSNTWLLTHVLKLASFSDMPIEQITSKMLIDYGDGIAWGTKGAINRSNELAAICRVLDWGVAKQKIARNVLTEGGQKLVLPARAEIRDRALGFRDAGDDEQDFVADELIAFWHAAGKMGHPFGPLLRLLLLTGARRDEVAEMPWSELDLPNKLWRLPAERAKNGRAHNIPLSPLAMEIIADIPQIGHCPYVFTSNGRSSVGGFSWAKNRMDQLMGDGIPHWRFHDLRRACATGMEMLQIDPRTIEACLNHKSGVKRGLTRTYQTFRWSDAKGPAFALWSAFLSGLLAGEDADALIARLTGQTASQRAAA